MRMSTLMTVSLLAAALGCLSPTAGAQTPEPRGSSPSFVAAGSGVNIAITRILANAFMASHPTVKIDVPASIGSRGAIRAVADNALTFGLLSKPLKDEEKSPDVILLPYARAALVIGVHPAVADDAITSQEFVDIFKGAKTKWKDGSEIVVQSREAFDSGFMILEKEIPGFKEAVDESRKAERWSLSFTDQEANYSIANVRHSIGVTDLGMISTEHLTIKPLKLNGVAPTVENLQGGQYPLVRTLYLLYRDKTLPAEARAFVDFIRSDEGANILKANGYLPM